VYLREVNAAIPERFARTFPSPREKVGKFPGERAGEGGEKAEGQVASNVGQNQMKLASQSLPR